MPRPLADAGKPFKWKGREKEYLKEYQAKWMEVNGDAKRAYLREYYATHKADYAARYNEWRKRDDVRNRRNAKTRLRYEKRKSIIAAQRKAWRTKNPGKVMEWVRRRQVRQCGARVCPSAKEFYQKVRSTDLLPCHYCHTLMRGADAHVDHIIPISRGGAHDAGNLVAACQTCNCRKNNKTPEEFEEYRKVVGF